MLGGGFLGAITRYLLSAIIQGALGKGWPYDIFVINLTGAFVLALVTTLADTTTLIGPTRRLFINVGFLGAYTTFSSMALGDVLLLGQGRWLAASLYLLLSIPGGIALALLGDTIGRWLVKKLRRAPTPARERQRSSAPLPAHQRDAAFDGMSEKSGMLLRADEGRSEAKRRR